MSDPYPAVADQFKLLATAALLCGTDPVAIFDAVEELNPTPDGQRRRIEIIEEWRRRRNEFRWFFDRRYWDEEIRRSRMLIGDDSECP